MAKPRTLRKKQKTCASAQWGGQGIMAFYTSTLEAELEAAGVRVEVLAFDWQEAHVAHERLSRHSLALTISPDRLDSQIRLSEKGADSGSLAIAGRLFFIPAEVNLEGRGGGFKARSVFCHFDPDWFEDVTGFGGEWEPQMLSACIDLGDARLTEMVSRLGQEAMAPGLASRRLAEGLGMTAAVELARRLTSANARSKAGPQQLLPWQLRRITGYFKSLASYAPDLTELADQCGVSSRHLRRLFKATTHKTIYDYASEVWTGKAKQMLCETELPLKEISARLGFSDPGAFSVAFRRAAGLAPRSYRQQSRSAPLGH
jgi:AraC family transcriptional regulator